MFMRLSHRVLVAFGANLGDRERTVRQGLDAVAEAPGVRLVAISPLYASDPVGLTDQPEFINGVAAFDTALEPELLLLLLQHVEREYGRVRTVENGPRTLDLDILFYDGESPHASATLTLPHPRWRERPFVTAPLTEVLTRCGWADDPMWRGIHAAAMRTDRTTGVRPVAPDPGEV